MSAKKFARFNVVLAFCLVTVGLLANPWLLGYLLGLSSMSLQAKIFIGALEIISVSGGLLVYLKGNTPQGRKHLAFGVIAVILAVIAIEGGLRITNLAVGGGGQQQVVDKRILMSPYEGKAWAETYWKEAHEFELTSDYEPFVGWKYGEYHGDYINVDSEGVRKTWNPEYSQGEVPGTIYVFGGSTTWGTGARDDYTIPSHLSKLLNSSGYAFSVHNHAQLAYTFKQEIIRLVLLLREGHRPDYVIFYDGANDVYGTYQSGIPGSIMNVSTMRGKLRTSSSIRDVLYAIANKAMDAFRTHSMIYKAIASGIAFVSPQQQFQEVTSKYDDEEVQLLSQGIAEEYLTSMGLLDHLAQAYGFEYICFWQPVSYSEERFTEEEANSIQRINDKALSNLYRMTNDAWAAKSGPLFFNISDVLGNRTKTLYIDSAHLSEEGNEVVATKVFEIFEKEFLQ